MVGATTNGKEGRFADSEDPELQNLSASDYLDPLRSELVEHLRRAKASLEPVGNHAVGNLGAAVCVAEVGQALTVLRPLGLEPLAMLAEDIRRLAGLLETQPEVRRATTTDLLRYGIDLLRDGVERRALGQQDDAWALLAALNELRAAVGMPLASGLRQFAPGLEDAFAALAAERRDVRPEFAEVSRSQRVVLHRAMYLWYSGREPERALRKLRRVALAMRRAAGVPPVQRLFLILEAVAIGLAEQGGPPTQTLRRLLLQIDGLLKIGAEVGEAALAAALPLSLVRNLLFQVAACGSSHRIVEAVRRSSDLRLLGVSGFDGRERLAPLIGAEAARVRELLEGAAGGRHAVAAALTEAVQNLSDLLGFAHLGEQRRQLDAPLAALAQPGPSGVVQPDALTGLRAALATIDRELGTGSFAPGLARQVVKETSAPTEMTEPIEPGEPTELAESPEPMRGDERAAEAESAQSPDVPSGIASSAATSALQAGDEGLADAVAAEIGAATAARHGAGELEALDEDIREVFLDEAAEKVDVLRDAYVAWSAQCEDEQTLGTVLRLLGELKSTGRLVGAHTLSEVCWVLQAALERCRDGLLPTVEAVLSVLDQGVETVDALVAAHVSGTPVAEDARAVEQRLYALLSADPATLERLAPTRWRPRRASAPEGAESPGEETEDLLATSDLNVADILAGEAEDLVEILEDGLAGLARQPDATGWLVEVRRALESLAATARYAQSTQVAALSEAFASAIASGGVTKGLLQTGSQALQVLRAAVDALRDGRTPNVPLALIERLREGAAEAPAAEAATEEGERSAAQSGQGLEDQVAALRDYVGQLEGIVARLARLPQRSGADVADRARAIEELGPCADGLHEVSLAIDSLVRGRG